MGGDITEWSANRLFTAVFTTNETLNINRHCPEEKKKQFCNTTITKVRVGESIRI